MKIMPLSFTLMFIALFLFGCGREENQNERTNLLTEGRAKKDASGRGSTDGTAASSGQVALQAATGARQRQQPQQAPHEDLHTETS